MTAPALDNAHDVAVKARQTTAASVSPLRGWHGEFLRYLLCSAAALAVDFLAYSLALRLHLAYPTAAALGFGLGLWTAYSLSVRYAFKQRALADRRVEFLVFAGIGLLGLLLTEFLLWYLIGQLRFEAHLAKLIGAGLVFLFNFVLRKSLLFWQRRPGTPREYP
jgi:putative flippase GtrA